MMEQATQLVRLLKEQHKKVACAESCTGGLVAGAITDIAGASQVLELSMVTYCDAAKHRMLGVDSNTLATKTAVSAEVAEQMALGIRKAAGADLGISVTGIAGPEGGTAEKPVGLVYFGIAVGEKVTAYSYVFPGDRTQIRAQAVAQALCLGIEALIEALNEIK